MPAQPAALNSLAGPRAGIAAATLALPMPRTRCSQPRVAMGAAHPSAASLLQKPQTCVGGGGAGVPPATVGAPRQADGELPSQHGPGSCFPIRQVHPDRPGRSVPGEQPQALRREGKRDAPIRYKGRTRVQGRRCGPRSRPGRRSCGSTGCRLPLHVQQSCMAGPPKPPALRTLGSAAGRSVGAASGSGSPP